ncbi:hypothetical protein D3C81_1637370 [compost metagenome]
MPSLLGERKHLANRFATQPLPSLNNSAGRHQRSLARQHDVHVIHDIPSRHPAEQRHADDAPDQAFQRQPALAYSRDTCRFEGLFHNVWIKQGSKPFEGMWPRCHFMSEGQGF